jgi:hypothetical protein
MRARFPLFGDYRNNPFHYIRFYRFLTKYFILILVYKGTEAVLGKNEFES